MYPGFLEKNTVFLSVRVFLSWNAIYNKIVFNTSKEWCRKTVCPAQHHTSHAQIPPKQNGNMAKVDCYTGATLGQGDSHSNIFKPIAMALC